MNDLRIITTGGTFDKQYDPIKGELTFVGTQLPKILKQCRCTLTTEVEGPIAIDSLFMNEEQRKDIAEIILRAPEDRIIVVHGTDTMVKTAQLVKSMKNDNKTIVFTGAMVPYSLSNSDAIFNLGCAMSAVQILTPGVYVCMSGRVFDCSKVVKDVTKGIFVDNN